MRKLLIVAAGVNLLIFLIFFFAKGYSWLLISIHSLTVITILVIAQVRAHSVLRIKWKEYLFLAAIVIVAFFLRIADIDRLTPGMQGDEVIVAYSAKELGLQFTPFVTSNFGHGSIIPYMVLFSIRTFGDSISSIRLPSIIFGSLGVVAFFFLLRYYFKPQLAAIGALLFAFSYPLISLARVIYEPTASIFFQLFSLFFGLLAVKHRSFTFFAAAGLFLGIGNYTYVNFRLYTLFLLLLIIFLIVIQKIPLSKKSLFIGTTIGFTVIGMLPLVHYFLMNPDQLVARARVLSIFNQGLQPGEIWANIFGNIAQLRYVFFFPGDPNFRINPGKSAMIDIVTTTFFITGFAYLIKKRLGYLLIFLFLAVPFILSDILAYESGPANTFYGFAHPNTLRLSGIIPFMLILAVYGLQAFGKLISRNLLDNGSDKATIRLYLIYSSVIVLGVCFFLNYSLYFFQPYDPYTNSVNGVTQLKMVRQVNSMERGLKIYATLPIKEDIRFKYFLRPERNIYLFEPSSASEAKDIIKNADVVLIDSGFNLEILKELVDNNTTGKRLLIHKAPDGVDAFMFLQNNQLAIDDFLPI